MSEMIHPSEEEIIKINKRLGENGVLVHESNLKAVLEKAKHSKTIEDAAVVYLYDLIHAHAFLDGNKRTAFHVMLYFLELNKRKFKYKTGYEYNVEELVYGIAIDAIKRPQVKKFVKDGLI